MLRIPLLALVAILVLSICLNTHDAAASETKPNVLLIAVDDLRPELGCYGANHIHSPNLDQFAKTAMRFERAYCQQAVCNPSRTSMMTGLRPDTIGVTGNHIHFRTNKPGVVTLPQHFINHGYHAAAIGKIYHGVFPDGASITRWDTMGDPQSWSEPAIRFGPRYYYTEKGIAAAKQVYQQTYKPKHAAPDDWTTKLVFGPATESPDVADRVLYDGKVAETAIQKLAQLKEREQPFFLAVGFIKPHSPYIAPKKYFDLYNEVELATDQQLPVGAPRFAGHRSGELRRYTDQPNRGAIPATNQIDVRHAYYACVSFIDAQIGRLLEQLSDLGLDQNTIVCVYGDHGYHLGEQGLWGKTTNFELDTRVPLFIRAPGMKAAGESSRSLVELVDIYPTLSSLAGLPNPVDLEGESFASVLDHSQSPTKEFALSQYPRSGGLMGYSMRTSTHRFTQWIHQKTGRVHASELYRYDGGQVETENIVDRAENSQLLNKLRLQFDAAFATNCSSSEPPSTAPVSKTDAPSFPNRDPHLPAHRDQYTPTDDYVETSFEDMKPGAIANRKSSLGTWRRVAGKALVDSKHAKTGNRCLQIAGGEKSTVVLELNDNINTSGILSFWAERWTSRSPFQFRIEKYSGRTWTEIYNGDNQVKVGRAFLSHIKVPLADDQITKLRFSVTSPPNTGILIDDLKIAPGSPMKIESVEAVPFTLPALVGVEHSAIAKVKIRTTGTLSALSIREIEASLTGNASAKNVERLQPFFGGSDPNFRWDVPLGKSISTNQVAAHSFSANQPLTEGDNYLWLACKLKPDADIGTTVSAQIQTITFSNGEINTLNSDPSVQRLGIAVRNAGDDGVHTYRIPGLATTNQGTLIGVYDVRHDGSRDLPGNIDVGMSRSTDGGRTWEPMKIIMDMGSDPKWRGDGIGDPGILVDRQTGTIWVSATWSHGNRSWFGSGPGLRPEETGQWILVKSDDDGRTWSRPINITRQVKKPEWSFLLQGPGKGITMSNGTLVLPAQYQDPPNRRNKKANRLPHSTFIYSRDHGKTWSTATGAWDDTTESQIIELADGELMLNCRNNRSSKRAIMMTHDMGASWQRHTTHASALIEPGSCMASLINVGRELGWRQLRSRFDHQFLLFSNPDSLQGRNHMTIKASSDSGKSWPEEHQLLIDEQTGRGYSCMTMIDSETVGILYESSQADMAFQRIKLSDILKPPRDQKTKNPAQLKKK